jgi:hypothetical protein
VQFLFPVWIQSALSPEVNRFIDHLGYLCTLPKVKVIFSLYRGCIKVRRRHGIIAEMAAPGILQSEHKGVGKHFIKILLILLLQPLKLRPVRRIDKGFETAYLTVNLRAICGMPPAKSQQNRNHREK